MRSLLASVAVVLLLTVAAVSLAPAQTGVYTQNGGAASKKNETIAATATDESAVYVLNSGNVTLTNCTLTKTGDATSVDVASQYGTNAAILAKSAGKVTVTGSHSAGIYSTGIITVSNATVTSLADCGGVIDGANSIRVFSGQNRMSLESSRSGRWNTQGVSEESSRLNTSLRLLTKENSHESFFSESSLS